MDISSVLHRGILDPYISNQDTITMDDTGGPIISDNQDIGEWFCLEKLGGKKTSKKIKAVEIYEEPLWKIKRSEDEVSGEKEEIVLFCLVHKNFLGFTLPLNGTYRYSQETETVKIPKESIDQYIWLVYYKKTNITWGMAKMATMKEMEYYELFGHNLSKVVVKYIKRENE